MTSDLTDAQLALLRSQRRGVLTTLKRDGRPQLSNVGYHHSAATPETAGVIRISVTADRAKTKNLHRDPRASLHVTTPDLGAYLVVEGIAQLSPVAADPADDTVAELVALYRAIAGEHPDWDEFRAAMVAERRLVIRLPVERVYGWVP